MDLRNIFNVPGKPGLYELISKNKNGAIVESLIDKKRIPLFATEQSASLENVMIYSIDGEVPLKDVFKSIYTKENGGKCIDPKSDNASLKNYMKEILPDYDESRVYVSDMKKLFSWYNILIGLNKIDLLDEVKEETSEENITEESK